MAAGGTLTLFSICPSAYSFSRIRPNITIIFTLVAVAVSFAWLGVDDPAQWEAGIALYILGCKKSNYPPPP